MYVGCFGFAYHHFRMLEHRNEKKKRWASNGRTLPSKVHRQSPGKGTWSQPKKVTGMTDEIALKVAESPSGCHFMDVWFAIVGKNGLFWPSALKHDVVWFLLVEKKLKNKKMFASCYFCFVWTRAEGTGSDYYGWNHSWRLDILVTRGTRAPDEAASVGGKFRDAGRRCGTPMQMRERKKKYRKITLSWFALSAYFFFKNRETISQLAAF